jgi:hypothetical protein
MLAKAIITMRMGSHKSHLAISLLLGSSLLFPLHVAACDMKIQDVILSSNGAAGSQDWEYNAADGEGWVRHTVNWRPGRVSKVQWRCVDNCKDDYKFNYRIKLDDGKMVLMMKATNREPGLIRLQLSALVNC